MEENKSTRSTMAARSDSFDTLTLVCVFLRQPWVCRNDHNMSPNIVYQCIWYLPIYKRVHRALKRELSPFGKEGPSPGEEFL